MSNSYKPIPTHPVSFIKHFASMRKDIVGYLLDLEGKYGNVWRTPIGNGGMISLVGPDALELVLKNRDGAFSSKLGWEPFIGKVFPGAIMAMDGDAHRYQRRIMQVAFRRSTLKTYLE